MDIMAPKGNTNAVGNLGGRDRSVTPPPMELILLGEEMITYLEDHPETLHISEFYSIEKMIVYSDWKSIIQKSEFIPYYQKALHLIGKKYLDKTSNVRDSISHRWQRVYFKDLKEEEDEKSIFDASLSAQTSQQYDEPTKQIATSLMESLKIAQDHALNAARRIVNKVDKSECDTGSSNACDGNLS
jgi:hypothetical protein